MAEISRHFQNKQASYWFFPNHVSRLRLRSRADVKKIAAAVDDLANRYPVHMVAQKYTIETYKGAGENGSDALTGASIIALGLACVFRLMGEDWERCHALLGDWPELPMFALLASGQPADPATDIDEDADGMVFSGTADRLEQIMAAFSAREKKHKTTF